MDLEQSKKPGVPDLIREARQAQRLTFRAFAAELDVAHNAVSQWENGVAEPTRERVAAWLQDPRDWVRQLGLQVFALTYGPMIASVATGPDKPPAAN